MVQSQAPGAGRSAAAASGSPAPAGDAVHNLKLLKQRRRTWLIILGR